MENGRHGEWETETQRDWRLETRRQGYGWQAGKWETGRQVDRVAGRQGDRETGTQVTGSEMGNRETRRQ